jgi:hypothetical protein
VKKILYQFVIIFVLLAYSISILDYYTFKALQWVVVQKAKKIIASTEEKQLTYLHISLQEFIQGDVKWQKKDEIIYRGKWYDIKSMRVTKKSVEIYAFEDKAEKKLVENYFKRILQNHDSTTNVFIHFLSQKLYIFQNKLLIFFPTYFTKLNYSFFELFLSSLFVNEIIKPPERV